MFKRSKKQEEPSVAFRLGEAMGKYTDAVLEQIKTKDAEIGLMRKALEDALWLIESFDAVEPRRMGRGGDEVDRIKKQCRAAINHGQSTREPDAKEA